MNIGLDIDNVISDFDDAILKEFLLEDKKKRNVGVINKKARHINYGMFDWSQEEVDEFYANNMERIAKSLKLRRNCKKYMDKLLEEGHNLILITHRVYPHYKNPEETTLDWLKAKSVNYTKLVLSNSADKIQECRENNVDIMIDDRASQCKKMRANGINCMLMFTRYNRREVEDLPFVTSWKNLYKQINRSAK